MQYRVEKSLGKGGMGEVFLAYDPICERHVALKKILGNLIKYKRVKERFLKEAKIASQLNHPAIIPIYDIGENYYTMPYVEGKTLKQILPSTSIQTLVSYFLRVCQGVAYVHAKGILHCDLKPENVIVGKYGEVLILDWGLTESVHEEPLPTKKTIGTPAYLAPEKSKGERSSILTDIYSLGVTLYQILTLKLPHLKESPMDAAPYRDIPIQLNNIALKCLSASKEERYQSVDEIINAIQNYLEGKPEWVFSGYLESWAFAENVILAKEWVSLNISKTLFAENVKIETHVKLLDGGHGIGFLLSVRDAKNFKEGFYLWVGKNALELFRANLRVFHLSDFFIEENKTYHLVIEKIENHIRLYVDGKCVLNYLSLLPLLGNYVGLVAKDDLFEIDKILVFERSFNITVSCLAVPDALMAAKKYDFALNEYRRISESFQGRGESREALFKAGLALLEKGALNKAFLTFEKLHKTPSAPLEYLGKALIYKKEKALEEEGKCLELAIRKFKDHPQLNIIKEYVLIRLHEAALRLEYYQFAYLAKRYFNEPISYELEDLAFWLGKTLVLSELNADMLLQKLTSKEIEKPSSSKSLDDSSPLFSLYGCYLCKKEGIKSALSHFAHFNETPFPQITSLLAHYLYGKIDLEKGYWAKNALPYEKIHLIKQLILFYSCAEDEKQVKKFKRKLNRVQTSLYPHS